MGELFTPPHLIVIAVIAFVLFGGKKLPELGKGLGEGLHGFKDGIKGLTDDIYSPGNATQTTAPEPNESLECAASFVPGEMRQTGTRGAIYGARKEAYSRADREPAAAG